MTVLYWAVMAINGIFIGMLFLFLNFNIDIGAARVGLIPSFIGYYFMFKGLSEVKELSDRFVKIVPFVTGMIVYSGILYTMDLFGFSTEIDFMYGTRTSGTIIAILGFVSVILSLYISYNIIMGIKDIEVVKEQSLNSKQLYSIWKLMAVLSFLTFALLLAQIPVLAIVSIITNFVVMIYYLYAFNKARKLFNEQKFLI